MGFTKLNSYRNRMFFYIIFPQEYRSKADIKFDDNRIEFYVDQVPVAIDSSTLSLSLGGFKYSLKIMSYYIGKLNTYTPIKKNYMLTDRWREQWMPIIIKLLKGYKLLPNEVTWN